MPLFIITTAFGTGERRSGRTAATFVQQRAAAGEVLAHGFLGNLSDPRHLLDGFILAIEQPNRCAVNLRQETGSRRGTGVANVTVQSVVL